MHDSHPHPHHSDMKPAYIGLIAGIIALLIFCTAIVKLTNAHYNGAKAEAGATH